MAQLRKPKQKGGEVDDSQPSTSKSAKLDSYGCVNWNPTELHEEEKVESLERYGDLNEAPYTDIFSGQKRLPGPTLSPSLLAVLLRFREHSIAVSSEIKDMFHQNLVTRLIIRDYDERLHHTSSERLFAEIRRKYWILRGREDIRLYQRQYVECRKWRGHPEVPLMADLPLTRQRYFKPAFYSTGMDLKPNPPKPPVSEESLEVGNITRTDTGESFEVKLSGTAPPNFPPNRITDLSAEIQEDTVLLNWTAPGEDLDQGTAKSYEIRWSFDFKMLRFNFSNGHSVNTTAVSPQKAGSVEQHSFNLNITIQNGTTLFFAVQSEDKQKAKSETSNIAQASKILPAPKPPGISNPGMNLTVLVISLCLVTMLMCFIVAVVICAVKRRKRSAQSDMAPIIANECQINPYANLNTTMYIQQL
ncbi:calcium-activated chloride channel regulator 4A-like [Sinocyclocheilus rhinocerous]|uniref:calcium-activated chloride channel regulator 4A-like n=1 Tax=Sinocyclocheilus rhinocerous TaxID=307959 RepID=UPI0007B91CC4|nr:PREDICTED: calcium-activated chloride channel regulator 4A-like [Sinocyclocheilus rhinocerous]